MLTWISVLLEDEDAVILNRSKQRFAFASLFPPFSLVELPSSSVRAGKDKAMHAVGQFHLVEVDE